MLLNKNRKHTYFHALYSFTDNVYVADIFPISLYISTSFFLTILSVFRVWVYHNLSLDGCFHCGHPSRVLFYFLKIWLCHAACGTLVLQAGIELMAPALEVGVLTTGPPRKSLSSLLTKAAAHTHRMHMNTSSGIGGSGLHVQLAQCCQIRARGQGSPVGCLNIWAGKWVLT